MRYEPWSAERARMIIDANKRFLALPILHALQHVFGCVRKARRGAGGRGAQLSRAEIFGTVTLLSRLPRREPPSQLMLKLCHAQSYQAQVEMHWQRAPRRRLGVKFGETTPDARVTLKTMYLPRALP